MRIVLFAFLIAAALSQSVTGASGAWADERHEGYYYPKITSTEVYKARVQKLRDSDRVRRLGFVTGMAAGAQEKAYAPQMAFFAKGRDAEKAILIGLEDGRMATLYRARAAEAGALSLRPSPTTCSHSPDLFRGKRSGTGGRQIG